MDDVMKGIRGKVEQNLGLINERFQEVLAGLKSKVEELRAVQESVTQSSKELDLRRDSIEERIKQVTKKEEELKVLQLVQEEGFRDLELKRKEIALLSDDVKIREDKLLIQQKKIKHKRRKLESIQKSVDGKFDEIFRKGRHLDEESDRLKQEIEQRENNLAVREEKLVAKEKELEARERVLDLKTGRHGSPEVYNAEPGDLRNQSRKIGRRDTDEDFIHHQVNDQFWAIYGEVDGMPRYYARIMGIQESKPCIAWLEVDRTYQRQINYRGFPVACGKFRRKKSEVITDTLIFSHQIHCEQNGWDAGSYIIYPRKGEIWALYKDWDIGNNSKSDGEQYNYEIVEVISDFMETRGTRVVYLYKIRGYVSLFQRAIQNAVFTIPAREMFRFSHQIPSYRINGTEGKGAPKGSFELDTAALPAVLCDSSYADEDKVNGKRN